MSVQYAVYNSPTSSVAARAFPETSQDHEADVFTHYEYSQRLHAAPVPNPLRVVVFNAMRGTHLGEIVERIDGTDELRKPDLLLASELDIGMVRSGNRHVPMELAAALGMNYAFAVEFVELSKGDEGERQLGGENNVGLHGNAILSRLPLENIRIVRLPPFYDWFAAEQKRIGTRIALAADLAGTGITAVSVHLENFTDPAGRARQTECILDNVQGAAIVAGDFNTSGYRQVTADDMPEEGYPLDPTRVEPLFDLFSQHRFNWSEANPLRRPTTPKGKKIDWAFVRGIGVLPGSPAVIHATSLDRSDRRISDHDFLTLQLDTERFAD